MKQFFNKAALFLGLQQADLFGGRMSDTVFMHLREQVLGPKQDLTKFLEEYPGAIGWDRGEGWSMLHEAASFHKSVNAKLLIEKGSDIDRQNTRGETPLMMALVKPDDNTKSIAGLPPRPASPEQIRTVAVLLLAGANLNLRDEYNRTAAERISDPVLIKMIHDERVRRAQSRKPASPGGPL